VGKKTNQANIALVACCLLLVTSWPLPLFGSLLVLLFLFLQQTTDPFPPELLDPSLGLTMEQRLRSVNDYASREALKEALASSNATSASRDDSACVTEDSFENIVSASDSGSASQEDNRDWILNDLDLKTNHEQSIDYETERLLVLKSYMILDTDESNTVKNFSFDRLSGMARRIFGVSSVAITLVDLGRLYFLGKSGLLSAHAAHRKGGPCAYTISSTSDVTIVNDTTKDGRFQDHPFVTGPDHVRFYAGAPILSPEGTWRLSLLLTYPLFVGSHFRCFFSLV